MKKIAMLILIFLLPVILSACSPKETLKIFMPGEYITEELVRDFEKEYGVRVQIITFDSNESAIPQVEANSYDLVIPSDYAIEELVSKNLLQEIDYTRFDQFSKADFDSGLTEVLSELKTDGFDLLKYGVPYFYGNVGILYDTTQVSKSYLELEGWNALANHQYDVMFYDSSRDSFMIAIKALYGNSVSINRPTDLELSEAETWLTNAKGSKTRYLTDEVFDRMLKPADFAMAVVYSGDGVYLMSENDDLDYHVPHQGTNVWVDAFVIPKNAKQVDLAYLFIDYFNSYDIGLENAINIGYTSPRSDVISTIITDGEYEESSYVVTLTPNDEFFRYDTQLKRKIEEAWVRVRAS
jgi:spermidine/putrescine-binding protein